MARKQIGAAPSGDTDAATKAFVETATSTLENKTLTSPTITTPVIEGTATVDQALASASAMVSLTEASAAKAYLQYRGTAAGSLPNTVRLQTQTGTNADIQIGTNSNADIFVAGGQNGLTRGFVGIAKSNPAVALDVTGEVRVSAAGTNAASVVTVGGTQTLTAKTLTNPTLDGTAAINQASSSGNATFSITEASATKGYIQYRGTTAGTLPNTMRIQTQSGTNADFAIGTNAGTHIFVAGGQNGLTAGRVGISNSTPAVALDVTGEIRASTAGTNAASVATVGGTQTLTAKTLTSPKITSGNAPATAASTGVAGQVEWDADYVYICTATNTWKRAAIATW